MNVVDRLLQERHNDGNPIRVGLVGAGASAKMIALHLMKPVEGIRLVAIANRTPENIAPVYADGGITNAASVNSTAELEDAIAGGKPAATGDAMLLCDSESIEIIVDCTGAVEFGAHLVTRAIDRGKHYVFVNTELDSTLGPILKARADKAGVTIANCDGDEPGVATSLYRYLKSIGLDPVASGNLKGMVDFYRTPETQREFAAKYGMNPKIVTSFADGTKLSMESTVLANATGFRVAKRGMQGYPCDHVNEIVDKLPVDAMLGGGLIDYALGAAPYTGAWVVVHEEHPIRGANMGYFKAGDGPFFVFYTPYHLPQIQIASTIARAVLQGDATVAPIGAPVTSVAAIAKQHLTAGEVLDGVGGFHTYGSIENTDVYYADDLLAMGLSEGCRLLRDIGKDQPITRADVEIPEGRLCDELYAEQIRHFS